MWAVRVYGDPAPKGSLKCVGRGKRHQLIEDNKRGGPWRERIRLAGRALKLSDPLTGPVGVELIFTVRLPASVNPRHRVWPFKRSTGIGGDIDKMARLALDALEDAGVLTDDAQVVDLRAVKAHPHTPIPDVLDQPGVLIRIWEIE